MRFLKALAAVFATALMAACGGGGGDAGTSPLGNGNGSGGGGTGSGSSTAGTLTVALSTTTVTSAAPATVTATVRNSSGDAVSGLVVTFATSGGLGTFNSTTALTNASGQALVTLFPVASTTSGADSVVASVSLNGSTLSATQGFQLTSTNVSIASFVSDIGAGQLSAYGQSNLTVNLAGVTPGSPVSVGVSSTCITKGKATVTPATVSTTSGVASFTYRDLGCGATDLTDALQATVTGSTASASLNLSLTSPAASSITFASATPPTIYLKGSGFAESSQVVFQVKDLAGNVLPNQSVTLEPTTLSGGLTLDGGSGPVTKKSDSSGNVTVLVNSGTVPTPVRVKATLTGTTVSTVSSTLSIAVGLPSQLNFSLSQQTINIEGYSVDGEPNTYTIIASDRLGNPVPDGTAINFVAEGSQIQAIGLTSGNPQRGSATVQFQSSEPRPLDGRITILSYALGEESFLDVNGNNVFDSGEPFQDLGNIFLNRAYDGIYNSVVDQFISLSISGTSACATVSPAQDPLNLLGMNKTIPSIAATCDGGWGRAYVRRATETVLSTSSARPLWGTVIPANRLDDSCGTRTLTNDQLVQTKFYEVLNGGTLYNMPATGGFSFILADANPVRLNPMPAGTTVNVTTSSNVTAKVEGGSPVPNTSSANGVGVSYTINTGTVGTVNLQITSKRGLTTTVSVGINTAAPTTACTL